MRVPTGTLIRVTGTFMGKWNPFNGVQYPYKQKRAFPRYNVAETAATSVGKITLWPRSGSGSGITATNKRSSAGLNPAALTATLH
ncbi:hypothetical protein PCASD_08972 [Puccinia coronata f. sp. avenae]|uniref:Uncharacterized protein n=1 Tax=Puccinia coronata f. sp. avenae TaxID=200324 RepID=A0A2N5UKL4_9BASI|nr:hypothetical protein PCASD_08972 [Puccinia coronata f. sp. avenae]